MLQVATKIISLLFVFTCGLAMAQGSQDMLKPSQVETTGESSNPANDSGVFIGGGVTFGQARTTEDGVNPGVAMLVNFEPGYQVGRGSWSRLEFSGQVLAGRASFGDSDVNVGLGVLAKIGFGYSMGDRIMGVFKAGAGPVMATFKGEEGGEKFESDGTLMGLGLVGGWTMVFPMTDAFDLTGGLSWTHFQFDVDDVKVGGTKFKYDGQVIANVPAIDLGLRVRF